MKRTLYIASGVSVLVTTLTYGYSMYRTMAHLVTHHGQGFAHPFFAVHTILAAGTGVLSLIGAYFLLTGWRQPNPD
jgi:methyl coenzyme M reductase beta subunit